MNSSAGRRKPDFLRLGRLRWESERDEDGTRIVSVVVVRMVPPSICCLAMDRRKMGTKAVTFRDFPIQGQPTKLEVKRQRFSCRNCGATAYEHLPMMDEDFRMTKRFREHIEHLAVEMPFTIAANVAGVPEATVRRIFTAYADRMFEGRTITLPRVLGMDEIYLQGAPRFVIGDVENRFMLDMQNSRREYDLRPYFAQMNGRSNVEVVCQDMWKGYHIVTKAIFPRAVTVIDKYHVQKTANYGMEVIRKAHYLDISNKARISLKRKKALFLARRGGTGKSQESLSGLFAQYPRLLQAYDVKERFYDIYESESRAAAEQAADKWLASIPQEMERPFKQSIDALRNWRPHILRYFEHRFTSAYIERLNGMIRKMNVAGAGYSLDVLRKKAILKHGNLRSTQEP